jgi:hypothetical protein
MLPDQAEDELAAWERRKAEGGQPLDAAALHSAFREIAVAPTPGRWLSMPLRLGGIMLVRGGAAWVTRSTHRL